MKQKLDYKKVSFLTNFFAFQIGYSKIIQEASNPKVSLVTILHGFAQLALQYASEFLSLSGIDFDSSKVPHYLRRLVSNSEKFFDRLSELMDRSFFMDLKAGSNCLIFNDITILDFEKVFTRSPLLVDFVYATRESVLNKTVEDLNREFSRLENYYQSEFRKEVSKTGRVRMFVFDFLLYEILQRRDSENASFRSIAQFEKTAV